MGGDDAPGMVIEGLDLAAQRLPDVRYLVFGDEAQVAPLLDQWPHARAASELRHTPDAVTNHEKASIALRSGRQSSMRLAINAAASHESAGVVSAGNTGALMGMAKFVFKTLPGIDRPAIATAFPTRRGASIMLDLGANVDCDENNLVQFAVMGEVFARNLLGIREPTIGIVNIGVEGLKGNESVRKAAAILQDTDLPILFHGFIEGDDIAAGTVDVVVTDGFTGNVALKTAEGTVSLFAHMMREGLKSSWRCKLGAILARPAIDMLRARLDHRVYNGAMFLGLNGICVKSHGGTDGVGFAHAIEVASSLIADGLNEGIKEDFARLYHAPQANMKVATG